MDDQYSHERDGQLVGFLGDKEVYHGDRLVYKNIYGENPVPCIAYFSNEWTRINRKTSLSVRVIDWLDGVKGNTSISATKYGPEDCHTLPTTSLYRPTNIQDDPEYSGLFI